MPSDGSRPNETEPDIAPAEPCKVYRLYRIRTTKKTLNPDRISRESAAIHRLLYPETESWRPRTRPECEEVPRPCPYVGCRHNNFLDVSSIGSIKFAYPGREPWEVPPDESCSLDVADRGSTTLEKVGDMIGVTRERIRQVERVTLHAFAEAFAEGEEGDAVEAIRALCISDAHERVAPSARKGAVRGIGLKEK